MSQIVRHARSSRRPAAPRSTARRSALIEACETRILFAGEPITVNTVADTVDADPNVTSLREAILAANANDTPTPTLDSIFFNIPGALPAAGAFTINLTSPLPAITGVVTLDATTQSQYVDQPIIELNGAGAGAGANGLTVASSDPAAASNILGFIINRFSGAGVLITGDGNLIGDSYIGTNIPGLAASPNGTGIRIQGDNNFVAQNVIAFNTGDGVAVDPTSAGNDVSLNSFFLNGKLGINLVAPSDPASGVTPNDANDADTGANNLQNAPVIDTVAVRTGGGLTVTGHVDTTANTTVLVHVYTTSKDTADPAQVEGENVEDFVEIVTDPTTGHGTWSIDLPDAAQDAWVTTTSLAIDDTTGTANTSEFSAPMRVGPVDGGGSPHVTAVYVAGSGWASSFKTFMAAQAQGSAQYGFAVPATDQLNELPWSNLNQISITFDKDVTVAADDLAVRGVNVANYTFSATVPFAYDSTTHTATWTLGQNVANDKLMIDLDGDATGVKAGTAALDGEWANGTDTFPSGNGTAGGDFRFRVNVLPGDANRSGLSVNAIDLSNVRARQLTSTTNTGTAPNTYNIFSDINGTGNINAVDLSQVRANQLKSLPAAEPTSALSGSSITKDVFGTQAILA